LAGIAADADGRASALSNFQLALNSLAPGQCAGRSGGRCRTERRPI